MNGVGILEREEIEVTTPTVRVVYGKDVRSVPCNGSGLTIEAAIKAAGGDPGAKGTFSVNEQEAGLGTPVQPGDTVVFTPKTANG